MEQYNISGFRSRDDPKAILGQPPLGSSGTPRLRVPANDRRAAVHMSLAGSIAVHAAIAILFTWFAGRLPPPRMPESDVVTLVYQPAAAEPAQAPAPRDPNPIPEPVATPAPPEPPPPPEPEPPAEPEPIPPPPPPVPLTEPPPTPEMPVPEPPPPPVQRPAPPRPHAISPEPHPARKVAAAPPPPAAQATAPPSAATAQPAAPSPLNVIGPGWQSALGAWLQAHKTYPEEARRHGDQGRATVRFTVDRDGRVLEVQLLSGTGSQLLDEAVEKLLRGGHLPPFPAGMDQAQVTVTLQIRYTLER
jgi:protein TonB